MLRSDRTPAPEPKTEAETSSEGGGNGKGNGKNGQGLDAAEGSDAEVLFETQQVTDTVEVPRTTDEARNFITLVADELAGHHYVFRDYLAQCLETGNAFELYKSGCDDINKIQLGVLRALKTFDLIAALIRDNKESDETAKNRVFDAVANVVEKLKSIR